MKKIFCCQLIIAGLVLFAVQISNAQYMKPPREIEAILNAPSVPFVSVSPSKNKVALFDVLRYSPISELAEPLLRLAGLRINPNTNGRNKQFYAVKMTLKDISGTRETIVNLPPNAKIFSPIWSADGKYIAFGNITVSDLELWIVETATSEAKKIKNVQINSIFGGFQWMPDQNSLLVNLLPKNRGNAPQSQNLVPQEPNIQETIGKTGIVQTFQDLLKSPNDEKLFDYYATSQLAIVELTGRIKEIGAPAIFGTSEISPNGQNILVSKISRPYSYIFQFDRFPKEIEIWDLNGKTLKEIAKIPLQDNLPAQGVTAFPRSFGWIPTEPATLMWVEALDGGDPKNNITPRDKIMKFASPFNLSPVEVFQTAQRYQFRMFGESNGLMLVYDYNRDTQHQRMMAIDYRNAEIPPKIISDLNENDRYQNIGQPIRKPLSNGFYVIHQSGDYIFLTGEGATSEGDRPFLHRLNLKTLKTDEIFRSEKNAYESVVTIINDSGSRFITTKETPTEQENLYLHEICLPDSDCGTASAKKLTDFKDPTPQLRKIKKQLVKYKRADGVDLSFTLYLPPDYKAGTKLPTVVWAYPREYTNVDLAGQVSGSTNRFSEISGYSQLFFLLEGYAVLDNTAMPVIGDALTVNDTYIKQIVDSAQAAVDKAVEMGVTDRNRIGIGGHSYGAFMTVNLLAHSDIFRAGIALSGAYNRTLTPFGFQSERRTFWEAKELYQSISPFFYADKIKEPLLLIHGEADDNSGTFPIQSERLFQAIQGTGGTSRLVMLPLESHTYTAKESVEHVLYEQLKWFDKYVKNAELPK